jgi:hypothetical protein
VGDHCSFAGYSTVDIADAQHWKHCMGCLGFGIDLGGARCSSSRGTGFPFTPYAHPRFSNHLAGGDKRGILNDAFDNASLPVPKLEQETDSFAETLQ